MGSEYAVAPLVMILALGQLLPMGQDTSIRILMGMNQHGRISVFAFIAIFVLFTIGLVFTGVNDWELTTAALLFVIPMNIVYGLVVPIYTCRELQLSWLNYVQSSLIKQLAYIAPFLGLLYWSRQAFNANDMTTALLAFSVAGIFTLVIYFIYLVPDKLQQKLLRCCKLKS